MGQKNPVISNIIEKLTRGEEKLLVAAFGAMTLSVLIEIITRYVFRYSLPQAEEFARHFMIFIACIGLGAAWTRGVHIICDVKHLFLGEAVRRRIDIFIKILTLGLSSYYCYSSIGYFMFCVHAGMRTASANLPLWAPVSLLVIGFGLLSLHLLLGLLEIPFKMRAKG